MQYRFALPAVLLLLFGSSLLFAQSGSDRSIHIPAAYFLPEIEKSGAAPLDANRREFVLKTEAVKSLLPSVKHLSLTGFPVAPSSNMDLDLRRTRSVVDAGTKFIVAGREGDSFSLPPQVISYAGTIRGEAGSRVFIAFTDDYVVAGIRRADGSVYILGPALEKEGSETKDEKADGSRHVLLDGNAIKSELGEGFNCATLGDPEIPATGIPSVQVTDSTTLLEVEVAVETDTDFFKAMGKDAAKAQAYTIALFSMVSMIYEEEVHVTIYIPWMKTWTENAPDPYGVAGDAYALPDKVAPYWRDNYADVHRDVAHVMTSVGFGGGGFGYFNALCGGAGDRSFSVSSVQGYHSYPTFAFTYDVYIVAHELGHNFNAPHSHNCFWGAPIDTCIVDEGISGGCLPEGTTPKPNPGSIMSYCGGTNNTVLNDYRVRMTFLPQVAAVMRGAAEAASCLTEPEDPTVLLVRPRGKEEFVWNRQPSTLITWRSARVDFVDLSWSSDGGANWNVIAEDVPATLEQYEWVFPEICARSVIVRLASSSDAEVADTTIFPFRILRKDPGGLVAWYPLNGDTEDKTPCGMYHASGSGTFDSDRTGGAGNARRFNGQEVMTTPTLLEHFDKGITLALWFRLDGMQGVQTFIAQDYAIGGAFSAFSWNGYFGGAFWLATSSTPLQVWGGELSAGPWYHGVVTYDGKIAKAYINGTETGSMEQAATVKYGEVPLSFGSRGGAENLAGELDEVRIYDRALTANEIAAMYAAEQQTMAAPLLLLPADGTTDVGTGPTLQWNAVPTATAYHLQLGTSPAFAPPTLKFNDSASTAAATRSITGLAGGTEYFWRVRGLNAFQAGEWSAPFRFTTGSFSSVSVAGERTGRLGLQIIADPDGESIRLRYLLAGSTNVRTAIFDQLGREVFRSEEREEGGGRERVLPTGGLSPGIYFCRITVGTAEEVVGFVVGR